MDISWLSLWRIAVMVFVAAVLFLVRDVLVAIFLALVVSSGLAPMVDWLERTGIPRMLGVVLVYLMIMLILGLFVYAILPVAVVEFGGLFQNVASLTGQIFTFTSTEDFLKVINDNFNQISQGAALGGVSLAAAASNLFGGLALAISVAIISFYLTLSRDGVEWFLRAILPEANEERFMQIFRRSKKRIGYWLQSQLVLSLVMGVMVFVGLWFLGVSHAFILGMSAAIFELIPYVGPVFAGSMAVLVAFSGSFKLAVYTVILFVIIQQVESNVIIPAVFHRAIGLHPVVVLASLMVGYTLLGLVGIILSVPTAVILQEFLNDWVSEKDSRRAGLQAGDS